MANRYWVGGTDTWDSTAGTKWSTSSGGAGGASIPADTDTVYFDGMSGAAVVTLDSGMDFLNLDCTGFTGEFIGTWNYSSTATGTSAITLDSTMTWTHNGRLTFDNDVTVQCNGCTIGASLQVGVFGNPSFDLIDDYFSTGTIHIERGTFNSNNFNVRCSKFTTSTSGVTKVLNMGSGTYSITGSGAVVVIGVLGMTFNKGTSVIKLTNNSSTGKTIQSSSDFYTIWIATAGTGATTFAVDGFSGTGFTMDNLKISAGAVFAQPTSPNTQWNITNSFDAQGTSGNKVKFHSTTNGVQSKPFFAQLGCTVNADHMIIEDSQVIVGMGDPNVWVATHSTDAGNNSGWIFQAPLLDHFLVEKAGSGNIPTQIQNVAFNIKITAIDDGGDVYTGFVGTADITSTGSISGGTFTTSNFVAGVLASESLAITNLGTFTITATETLGVTVGTSNSFVVTVPSTGANTNIKFR